MKKPMMSPETLVALVKVVAESALKNVRQSVTTRVEAAGAAVARAVDVEPTKGTPSTTELERRNIEHGPAALESVKGASEPKAAKTKKAPCPVEMEIRGIEYGTSKLTPEQRAQEVENLKKAGPAALKAAEQAVKQCLPGPDRLPGKYGAHQSSYAKQSVSGAAGAREFRPRDKHTAGGPLPSVISDMAATAGRLIWGESFSPGKGADNNPGPAAQAEPKKDTSPITDAAHSRKASETHQAETGACVDPHGVVHQEVTKALQKGHPETSKKVNDELKRIVGVIKSDDIGPYTKAAIEEALGKKGAAR